MGFNGNLQKLIVYTSLPLSFFVKKHGDRLNDRLIDVHLHAYRDATCYMLRDNFAVRSGNVPEGLSSDIRLP